MTFSNILTIVLCAATIIGGTIGFVIRFNTGDLTKKRLIIGLLVMAIIGFVLGFELGEVFYKAAYS